VANSPALAVEDEVVCAVPALNDIEALVNFTPQRFRAKVTAQKDGFNGLA
jgi:hypothetical protein